MAMRATASRFRFLNCATSNKATLQSCRFSSGSGRVLSDEERAAENMYIKVSFPGRLLSHVSCNAKHESQKEKSNTCFTRVSCTNWKTKGGHSETGVSNSTGVGSPTLSRPAVTESSTDSNKNVAVAAGVVALIASGWWYYRVNKHVPVEETEELAGL
ncbi:hypothetical protein L7F22_059155 [Adiantum nelumboides]|nr:hypothetical protein [Adiantum nelumboides]